MTTSALFICTTILAIFGFGYAVAGETFANSDPPINLALFYPAIAALAGLIPGSLRSWTKDAGFWHTTVGHIVITVLGGTAGVVAQVCSSGHVTKYAFVSAGLGAVLAWALAFKTSGVPGDVSKIDISSAVKKDLDKPDAPQPPPVPPAALLLILMLPFMFACECWQQSSPKYATPECAIARGVVDCGVQGVAGAFAPTLFSLIDQDYNNALSVLKSQGKLAGGCAIADIISAGSVPSIASNKLMAPNPTRLQAAETTLMQWRVEHNMQGVKLCFRAVDGARVCR